MIKGTRKECNMREGILPAVMIGILLTMFLFVLNPAAACAHAPREVALSYNMGSQTLTVTITHKSPSPGFHYISKVESKKNGAVISTNEYKNQPDKETFDYRYKIQAAEGDSVEVKVTCSLFGSKTVSTTIKKP